VRGPDIPLRALLSADGPPHMDAFPAALGDTWLCNNVPMYAGIRSATKGQGFTFTCVNSSFVQGYNVFPIGYLTQIISSSNIPYFDNRSPMEKLANECSILAVDATFLANNLKRNVTLHEACHCLASRALDEATAASTIVRVLAAEAFANTVETMVSMACQPPAGQVFFALNSYHVVQCRVAHLLRVAKAHFAGSGLFDILFFGYYLANARTRRSTPQEIIAISELITRAASDSPSVLLAAELITHCDALSLAFRTSAAKVHFGIMGLLTEYESSTRLSFGDIELSLRSLGHSYEELKHLCGIESPGALFAESIVA
jgi:hypothetical protein